MLGDAGSQRESITKYINKELFIEINSETHEIESTQNIF